MGQPSHILKAAHSRLISSKRTLASGRPRSVLSGGFNRSTQHRLQTDRWPCGKTGSHFMHTACSPDGCFSGAWDGKFEHVFVLNDLASSWLIRFRWPVCGTTILVEELGLWNTSSTMNLRSGWQSFLAS